MPNARGNVAVDLRPSFARTQGYGDAPGWILKLELPEPARLTLIYLWRWRHTKRLVNPSLATLAKMLGRCERTVQRHLELLTQAGHVVRVYNGGRGRQCLYYPRAPGAALHEAPAWPEEAHLGPLKRGRRCRPLGDSSVTLNGVHSTYDQRDQRETKNPAPPTDQVFPFGPPPTPPSGGPGVPSLPALPAPLPPLIPEDKKDAPPQPPIGGPQPKKDKKERVAPDLWRAAWALWRATFARTFRNQPTPDVRDVHAMQGLVLEALFATRHVPSDALRYLAWGFEHYCRDKTPRGAFHDEQHPLWRLRRVRSNYGWPKHAWQPRTPSAPAQTHTISPLLTTPANHTPNPTQGSWERELARARTQLAGLERLPPCLQPSTKSITALRCLIAGLEHQIARHNLSDSSA